MQSKTISNTYRSKVNSISGEDAWSATRIGLALPQLSIGTSTNLENEKHTGFKNTVVKEDKTKYCMQKFYGVRIVVYEWKNECGKHENWYRNWWKHLYWCSNISSSRDCISLLKDELNKSLNYMYEEFQDEQSWDDRWHEKHYNFLRIKFFLSCKF